ncbi:siroheme decarboxylase subunit beta [Clostridium felsineum]|uniref:siroheme decarboxylase subunit beta n=1 Tax=Clostridium felsineum TaxID=36839 RepID=UPI00098C38BD|nr:Lrp/AsnC family transcriptional regulator [Clostridium felsineum]URZ15144.1 hypothetical protein CLFE_011620 [Clostridium felsineum DSM 794]
MCTDLEIIKVLQQDIPLECKPYEKMAIKLGISEKQLIEKIKEFKQKGILRRYGAVLKHTSVGFKVNVLVAWEVTEEKIEDAAKIMIKFKEVSHCYKRMTYDDWKYNMYTMIHGESKDKCRNIISDIAKLTGVKNFLPMYTLKELKKKSIIIR